MVTKALPFQPFSFSIPSWLNWSATSMDRPKIGFCMFPSSAECSEGELILDRNAGLIQGTWDHLGCLCKIFLFQAYFWSARGPL